MKTNKQKATQQVATIGIIALAAIITIAFIACKNDDGGNDPQPVAQSKDITIGTGKTVTVNYTVLPDTIPTWWNKLTSQLQLLEGGFPAGTYILIVGTGNSDFAVTTTGSKTATVSESWLSNASELDVLDSILAITTEWIK